MSEKRVQKPRLKPLLNLLLTILLPASVLYGLLFVFIGNYHVPSSSMETTLMTGDRIFGSKFNVQGRVAHSDIVVFSDSNGWLEGSPVEGSFLVKRVIGLGGDTVSADESGNVFLNGEVLDEPYVQGITAPFPEQVVPEGFMFLMGDNREFSGDSRMFIGTPDGRQFVPVSSLQSTYWFTWSHAIQK